MSEVVRKNILIIEANRDVGELFARAMEVRRDCKCYLAAGEEEASDLMQDIPFALALLDLSMAMDNDFRFLRKIKRTFPNTVIVVDAYMHQKEHLSRAISLGAQDYIFKPIKLASFRKKLDQAILKSQTGLL